MSFFGRTAQALRRRITRTLELLSDETFGPRPEAPKSIGGTTQKRVVKAPEGVCIYAIGDVHGRADLLQQLIVQIRADAESLPAGTKPQIVFLGDYIDRGLKSKDVIDFLISGTLDDFDPVFLMGNHEEALLKFLQEATFGSQWARFGGSETLFSYGLAPPNQRASLQSHEDMAAARDAWSRVWNEFQVRLPGDHRAFFQALRSHHIAGDYLFVHAGLRPGLSLQEQSQRDMLWIRDEFLDDPAEFPHKIVHGHTPMDTVHHDHRRIGLDTGAFLSGKLTAAKLLGTDVAFLST
jgi:serine/threonine protein phosphatase 1